MAETNLSNGGVHVDTGNDSIVIVENFESIRGGRSLNVTGFTEDVIHAGHVIIRDTISGDYKPMPVDDGAYDSLPANHEYVGVLVATVLKSKPMAGIMVRGTVNPTASPYPVTAIASAFKAAVPLILWRAD